MAHIEGRKYEVTLEDGRVVSRQRASQLRNPEKTTASRQRYLQTETGRLKRCEAQLRYYYKQKERQNGI